VRDKGEGGLCHVSRGAGSEKRGRVAIWYGSCGKFFSTLKGKEKLHDTHKGEKVFRNSC